MLNYGWFIGGTGGAAAVMLLKHFTPDAGIGSIILWSVIGATVVTLLWQFFVSRLDIPPVPKPSRADLIEAGIVDQERRIADMVAVCGEDASVVRAARWQLDMHKQSLQEFGLV